MKTLSKFFILFWLLFYAHFVCADTPHTLKKCQRAFISLRSELEIQQFFLNEANLNNFKNQEGYLRFCEIFGYKGMKYVFSNVSKALDKKFKLLNWQIFNGSTKEFRSLSSKVLDNRGVFKEEYRGMEGQARLADELYNGDMRKAFQNVSAVLHKRVFKQSGWQAFSGLTQEFRSLSSKVLDNRGNFKKEYRGMEGYARLADEFYSGNMFKAFINMSAVLHKRVFKQSGWQKFQGLTQEFRALSSKVLDNRGVFKEEYRGMEGQARLADELYNGDMRKAFQNVSAVLGKRVFKQSGWQKFQGLTQEFRALSSQFLDTQGNFKKEHRGMEGQARLADELYNGDMFKTFQNVSAVLHKRVFKQSGWQAFSGLTQEFRSLSSQFLDTQGNFKKEHRGMEGQARLADELYNGNMFKIFKNVSAVLHKWVFEQSGWQKFQGSTKEFRLLKDKLLNKWGVFKEEYRGMEGQARLADELYNGDMRKAFQNVSAGFSKVSAGFGGYIKIKTLSWKVFFGTSSQYRKLIQLFKDSSLEDLSDLSGQQKVAHLIFNGHISNTYRNVSTLREILFVNPKEDWTALKWSTKSPI